MYSLIHIALLASIVDNLGRDLLVIKKNLFDFQIQVDEYHISWYNKSCTR